MSDAWTQHCSPPLPGETPLLYSFIREWFRLAAAGFYSTTEVHGLENMPPNGVPCIVCFNHGNGLADPAVLIRKTPRMVRFCAKDSLWSTPIFKYFIRNSGAVPVYRPGEHGEKAKEMNVEMFRRVIGALRQGDCVGFAPEGVSRFLPYMEQPFKTGLARLALEAVTLSNEAGDPDFCVHLVPVGLIYTHREKFRSDLCMRYMPPIKVDANLIRKHTTSDGKVDTFTLAKQITVEISHALDKSTINAPTWDVLNLAITAARLHSPVGTDLSLGQYLTLLRGWVRSRRSCARRCKPTSRRSTPRASNASACAARHSTAKRCRGTGVSPAWRSGRCCARRAWRSRRPGCCSSRPCGSTLSGVNASC